MLNYLSLEMVSRFRGVANWSAWRGACIVVVADEMMITATIIRIYHRIYILLLFLRNLAGLGEWKGRAGRQQMYGLGNVAGEAVLFISGI